MSKKLRMAEGLLQGLSEAVAFEKGKVELKTTIREIPPPAPVWSANKVKKLRSQTYHMSQPQFALLLNVTTSTVRAWEQGQKTPSGSASRLLEIFMKDQSVVKKLMAS
jgi:putative transcriptional regulator